jgi:hypothetical protein
VNENVTVRPADPLMRYAPPLAPALDWPIQSPNLAEGEDSWVVVEPPVNASTGTQVSDRATMR